MNTYKRHRFPPASVSYAIWPSYRFNLYYCDIEDLLGERGHADCYTASTKLSHH